jgi:hypothetical protein
VVRLVRFSVVAFVACLSRAANEQQGTQKTVAVPDTIKSRVTPYSFWAVLSLRTAPLRFHSPYSAMYALISSAPRGSFKGNQHGGGAPMISESDRHLRASVKLIGRSALDQQDVGLGEPFQCYLEWRALHPGQGAKERLGEVASDHGCDLRHLARRASRSRRAVNDAAASAG